MPDSDGVVGTSGVSSEESAGELPGEVAEVVGPLAAITLANWWSLHTTGTRESYSKSLVYSDT